MHYYLPTHKNDKKLFTALFCPFLEFVNLSANYLGMTRKLATRIRPIQRWKTKL